MKPSSLATAASIPLLLSIGLTIFTQSFFLSRKSTTTRSSCHGASRLLSNIGINHDELRFLLREGWINAESQDGEGCWTSRRIDSLIILVVDALRFDFARDHLPLSIGSRLFSPNESLGYSRLYTFVADPPTVTMQRLKALTTGGLPTFADITGSFGGADVEEDSWVEQLIETRDYRGKTHNIAFVGDDTWIDLFPTQFDDSHPYPSFNTRDLDTVDNGCLMHLPRLLDGLVGLNHNLTTPNTNSSHFELVVAHFLGVDHVGHTYGPNDSHMERKLHQMDVMLQNSLNTIDSAPQSSCIAALVFGDHGMTEDGNHGGGTSDERNAGLFAHYSPGCNMHNIHKLDGSEVGHDSIKAFDSMNQIDLVPTISLLLGLPIPYANIGGLVPELLPNPRSKANSEVDGSSTPHAAAALALNAAQVWTYFSDYSRTSRDLPVDKLNELQELLDSATAMYKDALAEAMRQSGKVKVADYNDSMSFRQACSMYKLFLAESTDLGKQVWTQFDEVGMMLGIAVLVVAWLGSFPLWRRNVRKDIGRVIWNSTSGEYSSNGDNSKGHDKEHVNGMKSLTSSVRFFRLQEVTVSIIFMVFHCGILTFGNSYIDSEREVITFFLSALCLMVLRRWLLATPLRDKSTFFPLIVALCARLNDVLVTGHGLDPSIRLHAAHHSLAFLFSLFGLAFLRLAWLDRSPHHNSKMTISSSALIDIVAIICLAFSWWEKRSRDHSRNGFYMARISIASTLLGLMHSIYTILKYKKNQASSTSLIEHTHLALYRVMMFLVIVTGPSTASTGFLVIVQAAALIRITASTGMKELDAPVMAAIWRLAIRHVFFATNHHCSFNRLHFSAAFVATETFMFHIAGSSLFMNTFGWEVIGSILVMVLSRSIRDEGKVNEKQSYMPSKIHVWHWFLFYQWTEIVSSCISVSLMKRHLMVWAIFAPRFMFAAVFTVLNLILCFLDLMLDCSSK